MTYARSSRRPAGSAAWRFLLALGVVVGSGLAAATATAQESKTKPDKNVTLETPWGGFKVSGEATPEEMGLPLYPGARLSKDNPSDDPQAKLSFWGSSFGIKLVVAKYESGDSSEKVADFYRKALAKYGPVLECGKDAKPIAEKDKGSHELECDDDEAKSEGLQLKAGKKERQRIVALEPKAKGCKFALVYLETRKSAKEPL